MNNDNGMVFRNTMTGPNGQTRTLGNASNWGYAASQMGYAVNMTPAVGAVAWWSSGHVAWVRLVLGGNVVIDEYNYGYTHNFSTRTIAANAVSGYIHFKDTEHYRPFAADFNGDGLADIGLRDPTNGTFFWRYGPDFGSQGAYGWAAGVHYQSFAADFNGDGLADIGVRDPTNGISTSVSVRPSAPRLPTAGRPVRTTRPSPRISMVTDWPRSASVIHRTASSTGGTGRASVPRVPTAGATGTHYQPYAADFNGDNLAEIGVRDPTNGVLYWRYGPSFGTQGAYGWAAG